MQKEEAIRLFGTQREIARALKISEAAVSRWKRNVPQLRAYQLRDILAASPLPSGSPAARPEATAHVQ